MTGSPQGGLVSGITAVWFLLVPLLAIYNLAGVLALPTWCYQPPQ